MTLPLRVLVVEDEPVARAGLTRLLEADRELRVVGECADGAAAVDAILTDAPDIVVLDVQLPGMDGFDILAAVGADRMPPVIFVTAYDRYAVRAFDASALDYVLKPFDDERFRRAVTRAKRAVRVSGSADRAGRINAVLESRRRDPSRAPLRRLLVKSGRRVVLLPVEEIDWIEAADYCVGVHAHGKCHLIRETMHGLELRLEPTHFFRVHRSAIVNLERVREICQTDAGEHTVLLKNGAQIPLNRSRRARFEGVLRSRLV